MLYNDDFCENFDEMYELAKRIATEAHKGQKDDAGVDYINHPLTVSTFCKNKKAKIAALLHDTIEDTFITKEYLLEKGILPEIVDAVVLVTKEEGYNPEEYFTRIKNNAIAREVKIADLTHNSDLSRIKKPNEHQIKRVEKYKRQMAFLQGKIEKI
ncbi:HD domain-containing protein [Lachnobacterium bovis]|uniref:HD domain-containing protein n=1 Tax=Lachnobacterium bovis TaxID=140626 RepID=A0A1H9UEA3_9FIRM|nr:HD domain-containing protein [Lachnobacterium bovis]SES07890.1 HD domain-containing protein [Lachnobacterium bovis]